MNHVIIMLLQQSIENLSEKNNEITINDLEAEIINFASYIYLKDTSQIDFKLNYLNQELLNNLHGGSFNVVDQIIDGAALLYSAYYTENHAFIAKQGVRMNIQLADNYGSYLKSYFISKHKITEGSDFLNFNSPSNSLWSNGLKQLHSPTQRDISYKMDFESNTCEILILPFNPKVEGKIISRTPDKIKCISNDKTREFEFIYNNGLLIEVVMNRIDKNDTVKYHRD